jgi:AcrR family transcriptional regulator
MASRREHLNRMAKRFILEACARVVAQKGAAATIEDIAREADYSTGALYNYFKNKEEMLAELFNYVAEEFQEQVLRPMPEHYTFDQAMGFFQEEANRFASARTPLLRTLMLDYPVVHGRVMAKECHRELDSTLMGSFQRYLSELLGRGVREGILRPDLDTRLAALTLLGVYHTVFHHYLLGGQTLDRDLGAGITDIIMHGIRKR